MGNASELIGSLRQPTRDRRRAIPATRDGFTQMHAPALDDGALPARIKELMALAIAVAKQCDGCIAYHAKAAARRGSTAEEVAETLGVALLMKGVPTSVYGPIAWAAFEFSTPSASG